MKKIQRDQFKSSIPLALGNLRGSMSDYVCYTLNGETVVRSKPVNTTNAASETQVANREGFKLITSTYKIFKEIVAFSFPNRSKGWSPFNAFMTANFPTAIDKSGTAPVIDYSKLTVSGGFLPQVTVKCAIADETGITIIYKTDLFISLVFVVDQIVAVAKLKTGELIYAKQFRGKVELASIFIPLQGIHPDEVECCYVFVLNSEGRNASKSTYVEVHPKPSR